MNFTQYGHHSGKPVVYFHGVPGAPIEAALFDGPAQEQGLRVLCFDRFSIDPSLTHAAYYQHIARAINETVQGAPINVIGFSIGCHVALETIRHLPGKIASLDLVSTVAPLDKGEFLKGMAGKTVFSLAKNHPSLFRLLTRWQAFLAMRAPAVLFRMLFAKAQGQDKLLASQPEFRALISSGVAACFARGIGGYTRDIDQFLAPWSDGIFDGNARVHLWHGALDNWSPLGMADCLAASFSKTTDVERANGANGAPGLSHYACLHDAVPKICLRLSSG